MKKKKTGDFRAIEIVVNDSIFYLSKIVIFGSNFSFILKLNFQPNRIKNLFILNFQYAVDGDDYLNFQYAVDGDDYEYIFTSKTMGIKIIPIIGYDK